MSSDINFVALVMLIENNFEEFAEYCGSEELADESLDEIKREAGISK